MKPPFTTPVTRPAMISLFSNARVSPSQSRGRGPVTRDNVAMPSLLKPVMATSNMSPLFDAELPFGIKKIGGRDHALGFPP